MCSADAREDWRSALIWNPVDLSEQTGRRQVGSAQASGKAGEVRRETHMNELKLVSVRWSTGWKFWTSAQR